ncbi:polysaccharide deacetylase family protein [Caminibacter mediatlanticus]|uniref:Polysaccharide deacetylase n=1 Tax=Caminibacter mediatlanticus TB-2 TaxID=391592 RepID=A0AAI9F0U3_9BACT|nr:polysaccharide deacetylase family protein [Caminibacter mediatlanticus]EDM23027.1 putative polysaccharide deacetylase [Caminibacter mediatlanticus TB-2]
MNTSILNKKDISILQLLFITLSLIIISSIILYQLLPKNINNFSFLPTKQEKKEIYILKSIDTINYLINSNLDDNIYINKIEQISNKLKLTGYSPKIITEDKINNIPQNSILFAIDTYNLSNKNLTKIKKFLKNGGTLIFNYHFGYFINNKFTGAKNISQITNLKFISEGISKKNTAFYVPKLLSPLTLSDINAKRKDLVLYSNDIIPLFKSKNTPDLVISNWEITSTAKLNNKYLNVNEAGIAWHGFYGKGKWFYFSFPSYVFLDMNNKDFKQLISNIYNFSTQPVIIAKYPYLDTKKAIFISEDTEYKYENLIHFARLANKYNIHATTFCVAKLATQYPELTKEASQFPQIEIGSHSYSHTKIIGASETKVKKEILYSKEILEKITGKKVYGFRPPREEIDKVMENWLRKAGYKYVMEKVKPFLVPKETYDNLITIPRHGTDDYIYLINLDWDKNEILNRIIFETKTLTALNILYTLSVHTHLISYKSNISILENYFQFLKKHPEITPLKGIELANRTKLLENINFSIESFGKNLILTIENENNKDIKNLSFRIYWPNTEILNITPEKVGIKISKIEGNKDMKYTDYQIERINSNTKLKFIITTK